MPSRSMSSPVPFTIFRVFCTPTSRSKTDTSSTYSRRTQHHENTARQFRAPARSGYGALLARASVILTTPTFLGQIKEEKAGTLSFKSPAVQPAKVEPWASRKRDGHAGTWPNAHSFSDDYRKEKGYIGQESVLHTALRYNCCPFQAVCTRADIDRGGAADSCALYSPRKMVESNKISGSRDKYTRIIDPIRPSAVVHFGVAVMQRLERLSPTEPNRVRFQAAVAPGFSHAGSVPDDASGRRVFSGISRTCVPALLHTHLTSPSFPL
ncbi:hypothetical protein PR048_002732 [Dryococelus australis]|uniref:Uncharacterized protein n=1 Tax=Dryococelus australis TaxID=614101 RepID=A0ABQ9IL46_9NEOP|nr:hypothetical protein PR048_002732 [Dryococelus australis]